MSITAIRSIAGLNLGSLTQAVRPAAVSDGVDLAGQSARLSQLLNGGPVRLAASSLERSAIVDAVIKVTREKLDAASKTITEDTAFEADLGADSLAAVELVLGIEEEFGISIPDSDAQGIKTVRDAVEYIVANGS